MTDINSLVTLVAITHPDILEDMRAIFDNDNSGLAPLAALTTDIGLVRFHIQARIKDFLGPDANSIMFQLHSCRYQYSIDVSSRTKKILKNEIILAIASKSPNETIKDAYEKYKSR